MPLKPFVCLLATLIILVTTSLGGPARADEESSSPAGSENDPARKKYREGVDLFEEGTHKEAADAFREAHRLRPSWKILFNIGQSEAAAGRFGLALEAFEKYLAQGKDEIPVERKDFVLKEVERLRLMVGQVEVKAPDGCEVTIDDAKRGITPFTVPLLVATGVEHEIVVKKQDYELHRQKFSVFGGQTAVISVKDKPVPRRKKKKPPMVAQKKKDSEPVEEAPVEDGSGGLNPGWFWGGLAFTGAFAGVTIAMNFLASSRKRAFEDSGNTNSSIKSEGETYQYVGIGFLAATGAALVTTAFLAGFADWSVYGSDDDSASSASLTPALSPEGFGLCLDWKW